jgi:threonine dehydrogenase-like Zn-dependent dehydrogenase
MVATYRDVSHGSGLWVLSGQSSYLSSSPPAWFQARAKVPTGPLERPYCAGKQVATLQGETRPTDTSTFVTHRYGLDEMMDAYDVFADPADTGSLKVALFRT